MTGVAVRHHLKVSSVVRIVAIVALVAAWVLVRPAPSSDAHAYWMLDLSDPYREGFAGPDAFLYSPAFGQLIYPATLLPFEAFFRLLLALNLLCLGWLLGPFWAAVALLLPPVQVELATGNIHLPLAVMCAVGLARPGSWSFGLLTKVTPGIGLLWFVARREWRALLIGVGTTTAIVAISFVLSPQAWVDWIGLLAESSTMRVGNLVLDQWPVVYRLPIACGLMVMAAWRNRPAAVPLIVCFALPAIWVGAIALAFAVPRLVRCGGDRRQSTRKEARV
jgi:hypothetical protein